MSTINILDCTLRDGGYINNWKFDDSDSQITIRTLLKSNIEIIECGFLDQMKGEWKNSTRFKNISQLELLLNTIEVPGQQMIVAMIEFGKYQVEELPNVVNTSKVRGIRYSFRKSDMHLAFIEMNKIIQKGYSLFVQPISTNSYTDIEIYHLLSQVNDLTAYAVYIVDTQGSMFKDDFRRLNYQFEKVLNKDIAIGFHTHNNMQLSYALAIDFIEITRHRNIIIDTSIYGMGRGAGNLNTELLADYINKKIEMKYKLENILDLIDSYYYMLSKIYSWGYSLAHLVSASLECHPNYASFLINTKHLKMNEIRNILKKIPLDESFEYNKQLIDKLYFSYCENIKYDINEPNFGNKKIILIGSGKSVSSNSEVLNKYMHDHVFIALNHNPTIIDVDFIFFNNIKRYEHFFEESLRDITIVTNNLNISSRYALDFSVLSKLGESKIDSVVIMFINYLITKKINEVKLIGIDGYKIGDENYCYHENDRVIDNNAINEININIAAGLKLLSKKIKISYITPSIFNDVER
jgi:4-hydroxy 2-oxovalerate aldolase